LAREAGAAVRQDIFEVGEEGMAVNELAQTLAINASEVVKILFMKGLMVTVNQARALRVSLGPHPDAART
jgi:translation initiation factor IF-2